MLSRRSWIAVACLVLVPGCLSARAVAPAAPPERDLWYSIGDGQQAYGNVHFRVRRLEDGAVEYDARSELHEEFRAILDRIVATVSFME